MRAFLWLWYIGYNLISFLLREVTADGCLPRTAVLMALNFFGSLPSFFFLRLPSINSVFRKISAPFSCPSALTPPFGCGVKSEIRPDVNNKKKLSNGLQMRDVKSSFLASENNSKLKIPRYAYSQLLQIRSQALRYC